MAELLEIDEPAPHVRRLTLNRPEQLNAMIEAARALLEKLAD